MCAHTIFQSIYIFGLVVEFFGAWLLFRYGTPPYAAKARGTWISGGNNELAEMNETKRYASLAKIGFGLLAFGVSMQFIQALYALMYSN
jgi:hypothetical protein